MFAKYKISEGCGFESQHRILDGHLFVVKIVVFVRKDENKPKRGREWPVKKSARKPIEDEWFPKNYNLFVPAIIVKL